MKRGIFKRLAAAAAATMLTLTSAMTVMAAEQQKTTNAQPIEKESSVTVTLLANPKSTVGATGSVVNELADRGTPVKGAKFKYGKVGDIYQYSEGSTVEIRFKLNTAFVNILNENLSSKLDANEFLKPEDVVNAWNSKVSSALSLTGSLKTMLDSSTDTKVTEATDEDGKVKVTSLKGIYVFIQDTLPATITTQVTPFLVYAPMPNADGEGWNTDIFVYPKVSSAEVVLDKISYLGERKTTGKDLNGIFDATNKPPVCVESGQTINYAIKTRLAGKSSTAQQSDYSKFVITDTYPSGLKIDTSSIAIMLNTGSLDENGQPTNTTSITLKNTDSEKYFTVEDVTTENTVTITLNDVGLDKLNERLTVSGVGMFVTYTAELGDGANLITKNENSAQMSFERINGVKGGSNTAQASVYTYGIDIKKELKGGTDVLTEGSVQFELYKKGEKNPIKVTRNSPTADVYWVDEAGENAGSTLGVSSGGHVKVYGLCPGTYELKETKSLAGYSVLDKSIEIVIGSPKGPEAAPNATADGIEISATGATNNAFALTVINTKIDSGFKLPATGGAGTIAAIAVGFGLVCFAVVMLAFYRTKNKNAK